MLDGDRLPMVGRVRCLLCRWLTPLARRGAPTARIGSDLAASSAGWLSSSQLVASACAVEHVGVAFRAPGCRKERVSEQCEKDGSRAAIPLLARRSSLRVSCHDIPTISCRPELEV